MKNSILSQFEKVKKLKHPNLMKYYSIKSISPDCKLLLIIAVEIVTEYCEGGSLKKVLDKFDFLDEKLIKKYIKQILLGLEYLHDHQIVHNNLKLSNVLVDKEGKARIADYYVFNIICNNDPDRIILYSTNLGKGNFSI